MVMRWHPRRRQGCLSRKTLEDNPKAVIPLRQYSETGDQDGSRRALEAGDQYRKRKSVLLNLEIFLVGKQAHLGLSGGGNSLAHARRFHRAARPSQG